MNYPLLNPHISKDRFSLSAAGRRPGNLCGRFCSTTGRIDSLFAAIASSFDLRENAECAVFRIFHLQCARRLPALPESHPCSRLHGHSFRIELTLSGEVDPALGWVLDFADIEAAWRPIHAALDHRTLNDIAGLKNPTSENLAVWLWQQLKPVLPGLAQVSVMETHESGCIYRG